MGVLGHDHNAGKSLDAWSLAINGSWVGNGKSWEDLEPPGILGGGCQDQLLSGHQLFTIS